MTAAFALCALTGIGFAAPAVAQDGDLDVLGRDIDDWVVVQDRANGGDPPRLNLYEEHLNILTGASSILFSPRVSVSGDYRIELEVLQFDPGGRNEGFGLLFGGTDLSSPERAYLYFLVRQDGHHLLKRRQGERTFVIRDWEAHSGIRRWEDRAPGLDHIRQHVVLEVEGDGLRVRVNGEEVRALTGQTLDTDGVVGLRVNHGVSIRVERFDITPLAPKPRSAGLDRSPY